MNLDKLYSKTAKKSLNDQNDEIPEFFFLWLSDEILNIFFVADWWNSHFFLELIDEIHYFITRPLNEICYFIPWPINEIGYFIPWPINKVFDFFPPRVIYKIYNFFSVIDWWDLRPIDEICEIFSWLIEEIHAFISQLINEIYGFYFISFWWSLWFYIWRSIDEARNWLRKFQSSFQD